MRAPRFTLALAFILVVVCGVLGGGLPVAATEAIAAVPDPDVVTHAGGLALEVPSDVVLQERIVRDGQSLITATRGDEIVVIMVYSGGKTPTAKLALSIHVDAMEKAILASGKPDVKSVRVPLLGRKRRGQEMHYLEGGTAWAARFIAVEKDGVTIVASWSAARAGISDGFAPALVASIRLR